MANLLSIEKRRMIFHLLVEGNGVRSITRLVRCSTNTVSELQKRYCVIAEFLNRMYIKELSMTEIEADEMMTYVKNKENKKWVYVSLDRDSRLIINFHIGNRDETDSRIFIADLSRRLADKVTLNTDCLISYVAAVKKNPYGRIYSDIKNIFLLRSLPENYHNSGRAVSNRIETQNGQSRMHVSKLSRKTKCAAKSDESLRQHLTLYFFYYNFIKRHKAIKTVPAVSAGLITKPFTFDDLAYFDNLLTENISKKSGSNSEKYGVVDARRTWSVDQKLKEAGFINILSESFLRVAK